MAPVDFGEGRRYLTQFRDWAKRSSIKLLEEENFSHARFLMDLAERGARLGKELEEDYVQDTTAEAEAGGVTQNSGERHTEEVREKYPRYFIRESYLVKQGLNRDKKDTYEQKVTKGEVRKILEGLREIAKRQREFEINDLLSLVKSPNYQLYLVLGVLQDVGWVQVPRRGAYSFVERERFNGDADSLWERVSAK